MHKLSTTFSNLNLVWEISERKWYAVKANLKTVNTQLM